MKDIDKYIQQFREEVQVIFKKIRELIRENAPETYKEMAYGIWHARV